MGSFHSTQPRFISRGAAEGKIMGKGEWLLSVFRNNHTQTVLLYRYLYPFICDPLVEIFINM